jgi:putative spermidine/putrescine transport system permease protein
LLLLWVSLQGEGAPGLAQYARFFADGLGARVLLNTLRIGLETMLGCLLLCYPLALMFRAAPGWGRSVITLIVLLPLLTSVVVRTFAWIVILGRQGVVNSVLQSLGLIDLPLRLLYTEGGLVVALVQVQMPLMFLPLAGTLVRIAPNLEDASAALGAGAWRTFARVTLPLTLPGALAGCTLTFAAAVTAFITQSLVGGGQMLLMPSYIYQQAITLQNWPFAAAISMVFLAAVLAVLAALAALSRLSRGAAHV